MLKILVLFVGKFGVDYLIGFVLNLLINFCNSIGLIFFIWNLLLFKYLIFLGKNINISVKFDYLLVELLSDDLYNEFGNNDLWIELFIVELGFIFFD